jgi:zinc/manganese transport system permease protein
VFYHTHDPWLLIPASLAGALLCAACVSWMSDIWPERREALIGLLYVSSAMAALLAAQYNPHGKDELQQLLTADVLWSDSADVIMSACCAATVLSLNALRPALLDRNSVFYGLFAVVASLLVQSLGVFLVFALLIGPAMMLQRSGLLIVLLGTLAAMVSGLWLSWALDLPSGICLTLACALCGIGSLILPPRNPFTP